MFPNAKLFGLTTSSAVMAINSDLGYRPVTYSELTDDNEFWKGCQSCINYETLIDKKKKNCFCTAMLFDPNKESRVNKYIASPPTKVRPSNHSQTQMLATQQVSDNESSQNY